MPPFSGIFSRSKLALLAYRKRDREEEQSEECCIIQDEIFHCWVKFSLCVWFNEIFV